MGCDGGTIPRRDELVRVKKKPETKDKDSELTFQWRCCSITQQPLQKPIVMCGFGRLYNKLALIEALLNRDSLPELAKHIKSLKDIKDLNLTTNPVYKDDDKKEGTTDSGTAPYICPVLGLEMTGKFRFVALWTCGCVFSERVLKEVNAKNCPQCQKTFEADDVVVLNSTEDDAPVMRKRIELRQQKNKKLREKNRVKVEVVSEAETSKSSASTSSNKTKSETAPAKAKEASTNGIKRPGSLKPADDDTKKMKAQYSVAKDPKVTDVYKSLFTTHESEKQQNRAHWVTYNPFYN